MEKVITVINVIISIAILFGIGYVLTYAVFKKISKKIVEKKPRPACKCRVYENKSRGYFFLKHRDKNGRLVYMKGSYSETEEDARSICCKNKK